MCPEGQELAVWADMAPADRSAWAHPSRGAEPIPMSLYSTGVLLPVLSRDEREEERLSGHAGGAWGWRAVWKGHEGAEGPEHLPRVEVTSETQGSPWKALSTRREVSGSREQGCPLH